MEGLRIVLLIAGVAIVALVYWYTQREQRKPTIRESARIEPDFSSSESAGEQFFDASDAIGPVSVDFDGDLDLDPGVAEPEVQPEPVETPQKIVAIRMVGKGAGQFPGKDLILALRGLGLRHGKFGIFHLHGDDDETLFSVASLVEPGSFDISNIAEQELPGVSMFLVLPASESGPTIFDRMVQTARTLAKTLDGEVLDANGSSLSIQRERFIREEIIQFELSLNFAQE